MVYKKKNIGMFEKIIIDKTDEDENSVTVLRKCWWLWFLLFFFSLVLLSP